MDNYYSQIKEQIINNEITKQVKNYSINRTELTTYYNIGKLLTLAGKHYGEGIIKKYSIKLTNEFGKGYSKRNLWLMLKFYELNKKMQAVPAQLSWPHYGENIIKKYSIKLTDEVGKKYNTTLLKRIRQFYLMIQKGAPLAHQLTWSHYCEIIPLKDINKITYYITQVIQRNLSKRQLIEIVKNDEYERLPEETKLKLQDNNNTELQDFIKNPIIIHNPNNIVILKEKMLQKLILENIVSFLKELGTGFTFIENEFKIKIGNSYNYIDLLLFNYKYNSFVVIELKITELKKEYIGQIHTYMNYIDTNLKTINHNNTIGIIICKKDNKFIMEYCTDDRILSREYQLI